MSTLEELEKKIAELEQELNSESSSESESENDELLPIPHLPSELVCAPGLLLSQAKKKEENAALLPIEKKRIECRSCQYAVFWGEEAYKKHARTLQHRQNVILKAGETYVSHHEPFFCRACNFRGTSLEELESHRKTEEHQEGKTALARASYCQLCSKQFNSPIQLRGHLEGKEHKERLEEKTGYRAYENNPQPTNKRARRQS